LDVPEAKTILGGLSDDDKKLVAKDKDRGLVFTNLQLKAVQWQDCSFLAVLLRFYDDVFVMRSMGRVDFRGIKRWSGDERGAWPDAYWA
jgi:hypothetical protein